ncbi:MAG: rhomboid family intramembrane serine protease [Spirochaetaceae bacterium]|nr:MAG: rhomboid family intramembrane serine protease [Spirochaetaceae bacterium]
MSELPFHKRPLSYRYYNATLTLIILNVGIFLISMLLSNRVVSTPYGRYPLLYYYVSLIPYRIVADKSIWQVVTYMFVHGSVRHILFNMLALFIFGTALERRLGSSEFLLYYFLTGVGAGVATLAVNWYAGMALIPVVGASGAIYGLLLAYATLYPDSRLYVFGILPIRAPLLVLLFAGGALLFLVTGTRNGVAHLTHLAGLVFGYLYFVIRMGINPIRVFFRR